MIRVTDQYFWNVVFLLFFIVLVIMGSIILETEARIPLLELALVDYMLISLASWRLTQLFVYDNSTRFLREQFWTLTKVGRGLRLEKPKTGPRRSLADLLDSSWSFGLWTTASVVFFYLITPYAVFPVVLLALSALVGLGSNLSRLVSLKVEEGN